jgi:Icc-related predicted phosphoesterase
VRLVLLSDTHGRHDLVDIPAGDVLIHAGDFSHVTGGLDEISRFNEFLKALPHPRKIVVAGNHDWCFERQNAEARAVLTAATYLQDEAVVIGGWKFYGSPWQPTFLNWAFNLPRGEALRRKWALIPPDTDVLITHGPPHGIQDRTFFGMHVGCQDLRQRVEEIAPRVHVFGHIHEGRGRHETDRTTFINASTLQARQSVFVVELRR